MSLPMNNESDGLFDALGLRKLTMDCLEVGSMKNMAHRLDRLVNEDGEELYSSLPSTNQRRVCRNVFSQGSLVWTCRNCQADPTCVQCGPCFRRSNHIGHEVFFHKSSVGGCCDCGDLEAWSKDGCCPDHMPFPLLGQTEKEQNDVDPVSSLPPILVKRARIVICEVLRYVASVAWDCSISYEATSDNLHGMSAAADHISKSNSSRRGIEVETAQSVQGINTRGPASSPPSSHVLNQEHIYVRVHNDDIHTYDEVTRALTVIGCDSPLIQTQEIDQKGETVVASCDIEKCRAVCVRLRHEGLLVTTCRADHIEREDRSSIALNWLTQFSMAHEGLSRLVTLEFLRSRNYSSASSVKSSSVLCIREAGSKLERIHSDIDMFADTSNAPLIVLLATDPLLAKRLRSAAHGLYMRLLPDLVFKSEFGLGFSLLYRHLSSLFNRGIGTSADSIFVLTVQIFTTPSLVMTLSDKNGETSSPLIPKDTESVIYGSVKKRMWVEGGGLVTVLFSSLRETMRKAMFECAFKSGGQVDVLDSSTVSYKRFSHIFKSCEYVLKPKWVALDMLSGKRMCGQGVLLSWLNFLSQIQNTNIVTRCGPHCTVTDDRDSQRWLSAFALSLNIGSLGDTMVHSLTSKKDHEENSLVNLVREDAMTRTLRETALALQEWLSWNWNDTDYQVAFEPVSLHIPLHRFLSKTLVTLCSSSQYLSKHHLFDFKAWGISPLALMEFPLRALVLSFQIISARLWARNGPSVSSSALNYSTTPLCKQMRDLDIHLLQVTLGPGCISHDEFLVILMERFSVREFLYPDCNESYAEISVSCQFSAEAYMHLAEGLLTLILQIVTESPPLPTEENGKHQIKRELSHRIASGYKMHSSLMGALCPMLDVTETEVTSLLYYISDVTQGPDGVQQFNLNAASASLYDPTFWHLSCAEHQVAEERVAETLASELSNCGVLGRAVVHPPLAVHPMFSNTRSLLDSYVLSTVCNRILSAFVELSDPKKWQAMEVDPVNSVPSNMVLANIQANNNSGRLPSRLDSVQTDSEAADTIHTTTSSTHDLPLTGDSYKYLMKPTVLLVARVVHILTLQLHCCASLPSYFKESVYLLRSVADLEPSLGILYSPGMKWVISEYERRFQRSPDTSCGFRGIGHEFQYMGDGAGEDGSAAVPTDAVASCRTLEVGSSPTTPVPDTAPGPKASRKRAMAFMAKHQASFANFMASEKDLEGDEEAILPASRLTADSESKDRHPCCIMCHELSAVDSLTYVGFAQRSTVLSNGIVSTDRHDLLRRQYIVCASDGCQVRSELDVDSQKLVILPKGTICTVLCEVWGESVHLVSPVQGWVTVSSCLLPLQKCAWGEWGRPRPHVSLCGHAIHMNCWDAYFASITQRCESDIMLSGQMGVNITRSEFLCPMCKRISNILVPCIHQSAEDNEIEKWKALNNSSLNNALNWMFAGNRTDDNYDIAYPCSIDRMMDKGEADEADGKEDNPRLPSFQHREGMVTDKGAAASPSTLRQALLEGARKKSKCSYLAFERYVEGFFRACTPPWALKKEISNEMDGPSLEHLMLLWCSLGFSLASIESAVRTSSSLPVEVPDIQPFGNFIREALPCCMNNKSAEVFVNGLADVLEGRSTHQPINYNPYVHAGESFSYHTLPKHFIWDADPVKVGSSDGGTFTKLTFNSLTRGAQPDGRNGLGFYCCDRGTSNVIKFVPPPLLSWDLLCLSSCVGSIAGPSAIRIMCIARLAQSLVEPSVCQWGDIAETTPKAQDQVDEDEKGGEDVNAEVEALSCLRSELAESAGLSIHPSAPTGTCLSDAVRNAITPFYRTAVLLTEILRGRAISPSMCHLSANDCLNSLGLPDLESLASNPRCIDLSKRWGQQYRRTYSPIKTAAIDEGLLTIPIEARQPSPGHGPTFLCFHGPPFDVVEDEEALKNGGAGAVERQYVFSDDESELSEENMTENVELVRHSERFWDLVHNLGIGPLGSDDSTTVETEVDRTTNGDETTNGGEERHVGSHTDNNACRSLQTDSLGVVGREGFMVDGVGTNDVGRTVENTRGIITENRGIGSSNGHGFNVDVSWPYSSPSWDMRSQPIRCSSITGCLVGGIKLNRWESSQYTSASTTNNPIHSLRLCDLSHLGVGTSDRPGLLGLPASYVELYLTIKAMNDKGPLAENENALCLICGEVLPVGSKDGFTVGRCTIHARHCSSGCGVFFLVQRCIVLLMRDSYAAYYGSMYVDEHGEEDTWVKRGRPLYLSKARYAVLRRMYEAHQIAEEVCRRRSLTSRVIRNAYF